MDLEFIKFIKVGLDGEPYAMKVARTVRGGGFIFSCRYGPLTLL